MKAKFRDLKIEIATTTLENLNFLLNLSIYLIFTLVMFLYGSWFGGLAGEPTAPFALLFSVGLSILFSRFVPLVGLEIEIKEGKRGAST